jgi:Spy/CpxP family protein refolding chaperone
MKSWMKSLVVAAALMAMTSQLALAQPEGGGRRGGPGRMGGGLAGLMAMKEVQAELKLTDEDVKKIRAKLDELRPARGEGGGGNFRDFQNLSEEEREKRMEEGRQRMEEIGKKVEAALKANLTEDQLKRLKELRLQREDVASLDRAEVADDLKLSAEQKEKIKKLVADNRPRFGGPRGGNAGGGPPSREERQQRREKFRTDVMAVLTPEQKDAWAKLQGAKFEFPEPERGQGGGRRNRPAAE